MKYAKAKNWQKQGNTIYFWDTLEKKKNYQKNWLKNQQLRICYYYWFDVWAKEYGHAGGMGESYHHNKVTDRVNLGLRFALLPA